MSFAAPIQARFVLVVGGLAALALAALMIGRMTVLGGDDSTTVTPPAQVAPHVASPKPAATPKPAVRTPVVHLNDGLPVSLAKALRRERVVVAALWAPGGGDTPALAEARAGAKHSGAGFVALNVLDERQARLLDDLVGTASDPAVFVFTRPGKVALRIDGYADRAIVAQAAHNAGAR